VLSTLPTERNVKCATIYTPSDILWLFLLSQYLVQWTALRPAVHSVRLTNRQRWTVYRAVTLKCDSVGAVCDKDVRRPSLLFAVVLLCPII